MSQLNQNNKALSVRPIKTNVFTLGQNLNSFIIQNLDSIEVKESSILVITSKIVSLAESQVIKKTDIDKQALIIDEADIDLGEVAYGCRLTIKHGLFIPSAGIDESNSPDGDYILFPKDPFLSAKNICEFLKSHFNLKNLGVILSDSHTLPLRQGVTGIALSYWGFSGVKSLIGKDDIFKKPLEMTKMDLVDGLAASAVLMMGEGNEQCPLAIIENAPVDFLDTIDPSEISIKYQDDLYYPIYKNRINSYK